jgi:AcrR family transcriptional regulator
MKDNDRAVATKAKIIKSAMEIFSEKGFDGSRVDEIATRAKVNKAMLYYYFESKEKLLEEIVENYVKESIELKKQILKDFDLNDEEQLDISLDKMFQFMQSKCSILRIIIIELLKAKDREVPVFNSLFSSFELKVKSLKDQGMELSKDEEMGLLMDSFFFNTVSGMFFLTLGNKWTEFYGFDIIEARKKFKEIFFKHRYIYFRELKNK